MELLIAWFKLNVWITLLILLIGVVGIAVTLVRLGAGKAKLAKRLRDRNAMSFVNDRVFVTKTRFYVLYSELVSAGLMTAEDMAQKESDRFFVRMLANDLEKLGSVEDGYVVCQYDERCTEDFLMNMHMFKPFRLPAVTLHEES